jgi:hypothetical protein
MLTRLAPLLVLTGLGLLFFAELAAHPTQVLYSDWSDVLAEHLPAKRFLVASWRETGEMPLWCPYSFGGAPFVSDIQVGAFYPPHFILYLLPEEHMGAGISWLIVVHLIVAGWSAYAYARSQGLNRAGALMAGMGFMFAGRWLLHVLAAGHTITLGLAWMPLVLLCLERAIRRRSFGWASAAGVCFALIVLGAQPQWTLYSGVFIALWTLGTALEEAGYLDGGGARSPTRTAAAVGRWLGYGGWTVVVGAALAAVQLLSTWEAAKHSTRAAGVDAGDVLASGARTLAFLVGPAVTTEPANLQWEDRGGFALLWLTAAILAAMFGGRRVRYQAGVCAALICFALGGALAFQLLPGFGLFRQPARMLIVAAFPIAFLVGVGMTGLVAAGAREADGKIRGRYRFVLVRVVAAVAILTGGFVVRLIVQGQEVRGHVYWLSLLLTVPAAFWLLGPRAPARPSLRTLSWSIILLIDLWALARPLVAVRPESEIYAPSSCVLRLQHEPPGRVLDRDTGEGNAGTPLGAGTPLALLHRLEALRGYNPLDHQRFKEYLQLISEEDASLRPFEGPLAYPVIGNFPIRDKRLLDLLGTRYLLQPSDWPLEQPGWRELAVDLSPAAYDFVAGGRRTLPAYTLYENPEAFPRAFVVPRARALTSTADLKTADFHHEVLLENPQAEETADTAEPGYWSATSTNYQPNRVSIEAMGAAPGWLVLADVWFPGWTCRVDGAPATMYRANYLFRAVHLEAGRHQVVFRFEPESYQQGRVISLLALAIVLGIGLSRLCTGYLSSRGGGS